jgi:methyl-accepting chemotaxis protein
MRISRDEMGREARAGDHGRGSAVVAEEVRKLADGTAAALADIETRVAQSQEQVIAVQDAMHRSEALVEQRWPRPDRS